jgi:hypothetical protein
MTQPKTPVWLLASILLTALLSLYSISYRYRAESRNKAVAIAVEYDTVESYAAAQGMTTDGALLKLKEQGLGSVVLSEETVADMLNSGKASMTPYGVAVTAKSPEESRLGRAFRLRYPNLSRRSASPRGADMPFTTYFGGDQSASALRSVTTGIDPDEAAHVQRAGLTVISRMGNPAGVSGSYVRETLRWAHELGANVFLPMGDQVLGRRDALKDLTDELSKLDMYYASPEFTKLGGDMNALRAVPDRVVRLHSAQSAELDKLPMPEAIDRYSRAANERGMRILLVRPISFAAEKPLDALSVFIAKINRDCQAKGLEMGNAHPYEDSSVPIWLFLLIGLAAAPVAYFAGTAFVSNPNARIAGLVLLALIGALAVTHTGRPFTALMAAIAFPTAAFIVLDSRKRPNLVLDFLVVSLISLTGGLAVAGLLNGLPFFIRAEQFEGVKLAVFLPVALVLLYFLMRGTDLKATMKDPLTWGAALMSLVILAGLMFMSSRTGNDNPAGVSDLELTMRFLLDRVLVVRPRTKEFLIGHPLLIVGIGLLTIHRIKPSPKLAILTALALAGGAIGQTDIVNTLCHIHTPILLSLTRIGVGMVAGCIIGLAVWAVAKRWLPAGET